MRLMIQRKAKKKEQEEKEKNMMRMEVVNIIDEVVQKALSRFQVEMVTEKN